MYTQHSKVRAHCFSFFLSFLTCQSFTGEPKVPIRLYSKQDSLSILGRFKIRSRRTTVLLWWNYSHMVFLNIRDHRFLHERNSLAQISWHYLSKMNVAHRRSDSQSPAWLRFHLYQSWTRLVSKKGKKKKKKGKRCALFTNMVNLRPVGLQSWAWTVTDNWLQSARNPSRGVSNLCIQKNKNKTKKRMYVLRRTTYGGGVWMLTMKSYR